MVDARLGGLPVSNVRLDGVSPSRCFLLFSHCVAMADGYRAVLVFLPFFFLSFSLSPSFFSRLPALAYSWVAGAGFDGRGWIVQLCTFIAVAVDLGISLGPTYSWCIAP